MIISKGLGSNKLGIAGINNLLEITMSAQIKLIVKSFDTNKAPVQNKNRGFVWSYWPDSNRRPADYESAALPTEPQ